MLNGKTALVTGASRGIGKAIALELAKQGATVILNYHHAKEEAERIREEILTNGGTAEIACCDVSDYASCEAFFKEICSRYPSIDILVNNAGITKDGLLMKMTEEDFDRVVDINLKGTFHCIRFLSRQMMKQRSGRIINLSSVVGVSGNAGQANYAASKAGVIGLTKSAAKELASRNITVNAVAPGFIQTDMTAVLPDQVKEHIKTQIPLGSFGSPEDVAHTVAFLASEEARYITGQVIHVDGEMVM